MKSSKIKNDEILDRVEFEIEQRRKFWPLRDIIPNKAQRRCLQCYAQPHKTYKGKYPFIKIFRAGNGVGKTCCLAYLLSGVSLGVEFMNPEYFYHQYFEDCKKIRRNRRLKVRIVCKQVDVQENGSVYQEVKKWIPVAKFEGKTSGNYYTCIRIPAPGPEYNETVIDIKTFDQDPVTHAGPDYDLILVNEPSPQDIYNENVGRCRRGGRMALFLTPLNQAEYLAKIENGDYPDGEVDITVASIWENCCDVSGTDGILTRTDIEKMIRQWRENNELEVPARENGEYMHLAGSVYPIFRKDVHVVDPIPIDPKWNIYKIIDPHETKPPFCVWIAVTPMNTCYVIAEYPTQEWSLIKRTHLTIRNFMEDFKNIETGKHPQFLHIKNPLYIGDDCYGDPNKFKCRQSASGLTLKQEYEDFGCESISVNVPDEIMLRHSKVTDLLFYDQQREAKSPNLPRLFVFSCCKNVIRAFRNYQYKSKQGMGEGLSNKLDKTWMDPMDCVGYFSVIFERWYEKIPENNFEYGNNYLDIDLLPTSGYIGSENVYERFI